jgi:hypothetical protein
MGRWGKRWLSVPGEGPGFKPSGASPIAGTHRVGGRYVAAAKGGTRPVVQGVKMKSRYEANYAHFLDFLGIPWVYEPRKFIFHQIQSGTRVYTPDFYLPRSDEYHECKGYDDRRSRTQRRRLKKYYPAIKLVLIDAAFFASVERQRLCRVIPGWTCPHVRGST